MTAAEKADLIAASFACFAEGLHHADPATLQHEAERAECQQRSPLVLRMRAQIDAEQNARRAVQLLVDLGATADKMADRLRALGIRGAQCFSNACPLGVYLETNGVTAYVSREEITVPVTDDTFVSVDVPAAVATFVTRFDGGVYLDLIDPELNLLAGGARA